MTKAKTTKTVSDAKKIAEICVASPKDGSKFIEPVTNKAVPYEGKMVPDTPFWQRQIKSGNVKKTKKK